MREPLWLTLATELVGLKEIVGSQHEPKVVKFFADAGVPEVADDETAWCGAFVASMFVKAGRREIRPPGDRYNALRAREWLKVGSPVSSPLPGDLVIFERGGKNASTGHVGFYVGETTQNIKVLGGNQSNSVSVASYAKSRVLGFRRVTQAQTAQPNTIQPSSPSPPVRPSQPIPEPEDSIRGDDAKSGWERFLEAVAAFFARLKGSGR